MPPSNVAVALDLSSPTLGSFTMWPQFHNGVATGLQLRPWQLEERCRSTSVTRTWIIYNRPQMPSPQHGGLLLALGLQKHLTVLAMTDIYEYLTLGHDPTTVGLLLGMAAAKLGTADATVSKMLCLHIPALLPQPFAEMEVSAAAQTAAMAGIGLLYCGTAHRLMAEFLLGEILRRARGDRTRDREAYTLAAGLALGMITLGKGASHCADGLSDLRIPQRLHRALAGGCEHEKVGELSSLLSVAGEACNKIPYDKVQCSRIREGEHINTDVTAPGAILALGLHFLKTNSTSAAARLLLPDTHVLLDTVRPDLQLLRVVARSIILWDTMRPSIAWVESQLPHVVALHLTSVYLITTSQGISRRASAEAKPSSTIDWETVHQARVNIIAGGCFACEQCFGDVLCSSIVRLGPWSAFCGH